MKHFAAAGVLLCTALTVLVSTAGAHTRGPGGFVPGPLVWGVADDAGKYADDGGSWFDQELKGANLSDERWTLSWSPDRPNTIDELPFLSRAAPQAQADGIKVELALYGRPASAHDATAFCAWAAMVAQTAAQWDIHDFIVWNEPNTQLYWNPQNTSAPAAYESVLAACYDSIHAADPEANVIGFGLSPRSNGPTQTAPIPFIKGVGAAYRASGRTDPIMDEMSIHPYPNPNSPTDSPDVGYANPNFYGIPNLDRVKQAVYDAFNGTGQPTTLDGLQFVIDELGWQTDTTPYSQYIHHENVAVVSEQTQAQYLREVAQKYFACDPTVATVNLFLLADESTRDGRDTNNAVVGGGWQSGLITAGGAGVSAPKQAYAALAALFAAGRDACTGHEVDWAPAGKGRGSSTGSGKGKTKNSSTVKGKSNGKGNPTVNGSNVATTTPPLCAQGPHSAKLQPCRKK